MKENIVHTPGFSFHEKMPGKASVVPFYAVRTNIDVIDENDIGPLGVSSILYCHDLENTFVFFHSVKFLTIFFIIGFFVKIYVYWMSFRWFDNMYVLTEILIAYVICWSCLLVVCFWNFYLLRVAVGVALCEDFAHFLYQNLIFHQIKIFGMTDEFWK